jgi:hypothetical protein
MITKIIMTALIGLTCVAVYIVACWFIWIECPKRAMMKKHDIKKVGNTVYMNGNKSRHTVNELIEAINTESYVGGFAVWDEIEKEWKQVKWK